MALLLRSPALPLVIALAYVTALLVRFTCTLYGAVQALAALGLCCMYIRIYIYRERERERERER
jgi:hypothetical protein